jgi:hypothetical protein
MSVMVSLVMSVTSMGGGGVQIFTLIYLNTTFKLCYTIGGKTWYCSFFRKWMVVYRWQSMSIVFSIKSYLDIVIFI